MASRAELHLRRSGVTGLPSGRLADRTSPSPASPARQPRRHPDLGPDGLQAAGHRDPGRLLPRRQQQRHPQHPDQRGPGHLGEPRRPREGRARPSRRVSRSAPRSTSSPAAPTTRCGTSPTTAPAGAAGPHAPPPGTPPPHPTVASWGADRLDLFVQGLQPTTCSTAPTTTSACGGWCSCGWESLGGTLTTAPAAVSWGTNRIDIFVGGACGVLYHKAYDWGSWWSGWLAASAAPLTSDPPSPPKGSGEFDIYVRNTSNGLSSLHYGTAYGGLEQLAGPRIAVLAQRLRTRGRTPSSPATRPSTTAAPTTPSGSVSTNPRARRTATGGPTTNAWWGHPSSCSWASVVAAQDAAASPHRASACAPP